MASVQLIGLILSLIYTRYLVDGFGPEKYVDFQFKMALIAMFLGVEAAITKAMQYYLSTRGVSLNLLELLCVFLFISIMGSLIVQMYDSNGAILIATFILSSLLSAFCLSILNFEGEFIVSRLIQLGRIILKTLIITFVNITSIYQVFGIETVVALLTAIISFMFIKTKIEVSFSSTLKLYWRVVIGTLLLVVLDLGVNAYLLYRVNASETISGAPLALGLTLLAYYSTAVAIIPTTFTVNSLKNKQGLKEIFILQTRIVLVALIGWLIIGREFVRFWLGNELYVYDVYKLVGLIMSVLVTPVVLNSIFIHYENSWKIVLKPLGSLLTILALIAANKITILSVSIIFVVGQPLVLFGAWKLGLFSLELLGIKESNYLFLISISLVSYVIFFFV